MNFYTTATDELPHDDLKVENGVLEHRKGNGGDLWSMADSSRKAELKKNLQILTQEVAEEIYACVMNNFAKSQGHEKKVLAMVMAAHSTQFLYDERRLFVYDEKSQKEKEVSAKNSRRNKNFSNYFKLKHYIGWVQINLDFLLQELSLLDSELDKLIKLKSLIFHELASIAEIEKTNDYRLTNSYTKYLKHKYKIQQATHLSKGGLILHEGDFVGYKTFIRMEFHEIVRLYADGTLKLYSDGAHDYRIVTADKVYKHTTCYNTYHDISFPPIIKGQQVTIGKKSRKRRRIIYMIEDGTTVLLNEDQIKGDVYNNKRVSQVESILGGTFKFIGGGTDLIKKPAPKIQILGREAIKEGLNFLY